MNIEQALELRAKREMEHIEELAGELEAARRDLIDCKNALQAATNAWITDKERLEASLKAIAIAEPWVNFDHISTEMAVEFTELLIKAKPQ